MGKLFLFFLLFALNFNSFAKNNFEIIIICLGKKQTNFLQQQYPNFNFYYTPNLRYFNLTKDYSDSHTFTSTKSALKGTPKFLEEWSYKQDLHSHAIIFDKNGVGAWEGYLTNSDNLLLSKGFEEKTFNSALNQYVKNINTIEKTKGDPIFYSESSIYRGKYYQYPFIGKEMINFAVFDKTGKKVFVESFFKNKKPVLIIFYSAESNNNEYQFFNNLTIALKQFIN